MGSGLFAVFEACALAVAIALLTAVPAAATGSHNPPAPTATGSISGAKWHDLDADGVRDAGEPAIAGWVLYIDSNGNDTLDQGEPKATTDAGGNYSFAGLQTGSYTVREGSDADQTAGNQGFLCSFPAAANCEHSVLLPVEDDGPTTRTASGCDDKSRLEDAVEPCDDDDDDFDDGCDAGGSEHGDSGGYAVNAKGAKGGGGPDTGRSTGGDGGGQDSDTGKSTAGDSGGGNCEPTPPAADCQSAPQKAYGSFSMSYTFLSLMDASSYGGSHGDGSDDDSGHGDGDTTKGGSSTYDGDSTAGNGGGGAPKDCSAEGVDFGNYKTASIAGSKIDDANGNGTADQGEAGLAGFTFFVDANDNGTLDGGEKSAVSDAGGAWTIAGLEPGSHKVREVGKAGWLCTQDPCAKELVLTSGQTGQALFTNRRLTTAIKVVKSGSVGAQHGQQVTFTFTVTNVGEDALADVTVTDDKCSPVTLASKVGGDHDALLEGAEVWTFQCTTTIGAHASGEADPIVNTATATGKDSHGGTVTDDDDHSTKLQHAGVSIEKTGPATAPAGSAVEYTIVAENTGEVSFAKEAVVVTDALCGGGALQPGAKHAGTTSGDASPDTFDPMDQWFYKCTVQTTAGQTSVSNTALIKAADSYGGEVSDSDDAQTTLTSTPGQPQNPGGGAQPGGDGAVLPEVIVSGRARLRGPSGCVQRPFRAVLTGRQIRRVTFFLNGKRIARFGAGRSRYAVRVQSAPLALGVHRVTARVVFNRASRTRARTLRFAFQRCAQQVRPVFTG